jgi:hypothetical protein
MLDRIRGLGQRRQALLGLLLLVTVMAPPNPLTFFGSPSKIVLEIAFTWYGVIVYGI